ncbi:hypothetical protein L1987_09061 [Smallanthus sonchifolius]|uniref:Uncharacterized protein n=1 Tax=Smallanthus sonchifolius TaxID=185202 RepID=A0ACB9JP45_9ASTR|nr:hypothetical protein L1987_09061 [Smallanthus sonchifolius]
MLFEMVSIGTPPSVLGFKSAIISTSKRDATNIGMIKVWDTYPFGVDPMWHGTRSELQFLNSLKMKMSILLGVSQMNLGIILSYFNAKFFRNDLNICSFRDSSGVNRPLESILKIVCLGLEQDSMRNSWEVTWSPSVESFRTFACSVYAQYTRLPFDNAQRRLGKRGVVS